MWCQSRTRAPAGEIWRSARARDILSELRREGQVADDTDRKDESKDEGAPASVKPRSDFPQLTLTSKERQRLLDAKLREEWRKTEREAVTARYGIWLQVVAALASTATVVIALLSMLSTSRAQVRQADEARFADALKTVADHRADADPSAAIAILDQFTSDPARRHQIQAVLVQQLITANAASVEQITDVLLRYPDQELLTLLARQNRVLTRLGGDGVVDVKVFQVGLHDETFVRNRSDTSQHVRAQLVENLRVLTAAMHKLGVVRGIDLSSTTLSLPASVVIDVWSPRAARTSPTPADPQTRLQVRGDGWFRGIVFDSVDFRYASVYGARFERATFRRSSFDRAALAGVSFSESSFDATDSFRHFGVTVPLWLRMPSGERAMEIAAPATWRNCDVRGLQISPSFQPFDVAFSGDAMPPDDANRVVGELVANPQRDTLAPSPALAVIVDSVSVPFAIASRHFDVDRRELERNVVLRAIRWGDNTAIALVDTSFDSARVGRAASGFWRLAQQGLVKRALSSTKP